MTSLLIHHPLLFQSTKKISDRPIKFPTNPSSSEDELPSHHSSEENVSFDDGMSDYSPPWSSDKEDPKEEDEEEDDANAEPKTTMMMTLMMTLTSPRLLPSE
jgi:hypothetical protein